MTTRLPLPLAGWAEHLAMFTPDVAAALGPLLRQVEDVFARLDGEAATGSMDGYDGVTRRGTPERLLLSEWLLADQLPWEFDRRAVAGELGYLRPAFRDPTPTGDAVVLLDTGPDQLGAARLVQLAILLVLHRRARSHGHHLRVGLLSDPPGDWQRGDLPAVLRGWLAARTFSRPDPTEWLARPELRDAAQPPWLLAGDRVADLVDAAAPVGGRVVRIRADDPGPTRAVHVRWGAESVRLSLPAEPAAVAVLRGAGWARPAAPAAQRSESAWVVAATDPKLSGYQTVSLLCRDGDDALVHVRDPLGRARQRRFEFAGQVIAAEVIGRRLVVAWLADDIVELQVHGKSLGAAATQTAQFEELFYYPDRPEHHDGQLPPLHATPQDIQPGQDELARLAFLDGRVIIGFGDSWHRLSREHPGRFPWLRAAALSGVTDTPVRLFSRPVPGFVVRAPGATLDVPTRVRAVHLGPGWAAWEDDGGWRAAPIIGQPPATRTYSMQLPLPPDVQACGLVVLDGLPFLVAAGEPASATPGDAVLLVGEDGPVSLDLAGTGPISVHPRDPVLARALPGGGVTVLDAGTGQRRRFGAPDDRANPP